MSNTHARALAEAEIINLTQQVGETGATRVHELHGETLTIFKDKELFEFAEKIARTALSAPAAVAGWQDEPDAEDLARMRSVNEWHNLQDIVPTLKAAKAGEWHWYENTRCKYIEVRIDMRDLGCIIMDRERVRITPALLAKQLTAAAPKPSPEGQS